jgi:hypothetical protein
MSFQTSLPTIDIPTINALGDVPKLQNSHLYGSQQSTKYCKQVFSLRASHNPTTVILNPDGISVSDVVERGCSDNE